VKAHGSLRILIV